MKGICFTEEMFLAVVSGKKTQTRRIVKNLPDGSELIGTGITGFTTFFYNHNEPSGPFEHGIYPVYNKRTFVYLKEPWFVSKHNLVYYKYDGVKLPEGLKWNNKLFMGERYARYKIYINHLHVQRLKDITPDQVEAEGISFVNKLPHPLMIPKRTVKQDQLLITKIAQSVFREKWEEIHGPGSWDLNPYVWVYYFGLFKSNGCN